MRAADYHAKYYARELTKQCSAHQLEKLSNTELHPLVEPGRPLGSIPDEE